MNLDVCTCVDERGSAYPTAGFIIRGSDFVQADRRSDHAVAPFPIRESRFTIHSTRRGVGCGSLESSVDCRFGDDIFLDSQFYLFRIEYL